MSVATVQTRMTAEEFFEWVQQPENRDRHFELEQGEVVEMSRPGERHGFVCWNIGGILRAYIYARRQGYACSNDTGLLIELDPDTVRGPDLILYTKARSYRDLKIQYSSEPPTLAIEVLSPNDRWGSVLNRVLHFLNRGILLVWLIDPEAQTLTVCRPGQLPQVLDNGDEVTDELLPDFRCKVSEFFDLPGEEIPVPVA